MGELPPSFSYENATSLAKGGFHKILLSFVAISFNLAVKVRSHPERERSFTREQRESSKTCTCAGIYDGILIAFQMKVTFLLERTVEAPTPTVFA